MPYRIAPITKEELQVALLQWARDEGWNYSHFDVEAYIALNSSKIFSLTLGNEFIGCVILTKYNFDKKNTTLASIGLYLVKKECRNKIIESLNETPGSLLWKEVNAALEYCEAACLNSISSIRLQSYYNKKGFAHSGKINLHLSSTSFFRDSMDQKDSLDQADNPITAKIDIERIIAYENKLFTNNSSERNEFLTRWLFRSDAIAVTYQNNQMIEGYGVLTICHQSPAKTVLRLSPAYADSIDVAAKILFFLFKKAQHNNATMIELNVPSMNLPILKVFDECGFTHTEEGNTYLMTTGQDFNLENEVLLKTMALTPLEFPHEFMLASM